MNNNDPTGKELPADHSAEHKTPQPSHGEGGSAHTFTTPVSHSRPSRLASSSSSACTTNTSRIAEIRQKIADGSYPIDAARIADSLLNAARDFFIRRR